MNLLEKRPRVLTEFRANVLIESSRGQFRVSTRKLVRCHRVPYRTV